MPDFKSMLNQLRSALPEEQQQAIAAQIAALDAATAPYADIDAQAALAAIAAQSNRTAQDSLLQTVTTERDTFQTQLAEAQTTALNAQKETHAVRGLVSAGVRPEYEELLRPTVLTGLEVGADGVIAPKEGLWDGLKSKYPAMFYADDAAGTGTSTGESSTGDVAAPVAVVNGIISGVEPSAVLAGGVTV